MTVSLSRGIETSMFLRLCSRAPRINSESSAITSESSPTASGQTSHRVRALDWVMHTDATVVLTTVSSDDEAVKLVRALLDKRLIACGTLLPGARSLYRWQGKVADERETRSEQHTSELQSPYALS